MSAIHNLLNVGVNVQSVPNVKFICVLKLSCAFRAVVVHILLDKTVKITATSFRAIISY